MTLHCQDCAVEWNYERFGDDETCWNCGAVGKAGADGSAPWKNQFDTSIIDGRHLGVPDRALLGVVK